MSILTGPEIRRQVKLGSIEIDPYVPEHVNPNSVDLTLGDEVLTYKRNELVTEGYLKGRNAAITLDARKENLVHRFKMAGSINLIPGELYLMHTVERVCSKKFVPVLDGKSSIGRLGVLVHMTAGFGDIDFDGQYTLEVMAVVPVRLYAGMRVAQMRFHTVEGEIESYDGNYVGEAARGPVASRSWRQFK